MAVNTKAITGRIASVKSTRKITRAMQMISAVKMRRATENVLRSRRYASLAWQMLRDIARRTDFNAHPLLIRDHAPDAPIGIILITGNRGLSGGFTSRLLLAVNEKFGPSLAAGQRIEIILAGKKGRRVHSQFGFTLAAEFPKIDLTTRVEETLELSRFVTNEFINKKYGRVYLAYMDFASAVNQTPRITELLPLAAAADPELGHIQGEDAETDTAPLIDFTFEPSVTDALRVLLPRLVETQIYQAILESDASEHSARMMAMRNATEAAEDMITELRHTYNQARQAAITQEISEIVGGAAGLE